MQTAGARALREDDQEDMSREAVLLQWERKIEAEERRPSRFERAEDEGAESGEGGTVAELRPSEDATHEAPRRFERRAARAAHRAAGVRAPHGHHHRPARRPPAGARSRS